MEIKAIKLEHTNPSLGPHETKTIVTLNVSKENLDKVNGFINNSTVNNTILLCDYLEAIRTKDFEIVDSVLSNKPNKELNQGETISNLSFHLDDGEVIELSDVYRKFTVTNFYPEFTSYMVEKGLVINT